MRILIVFLTTLLLSCSKPELLPSYGDLPAFRLTDQFGAERTLEELEGYVWVADFVFTRCAGPCPRLSRHMAKVQELLAEEPMVRFVSVSVDPEYDTPDRLAEYARRFGANTATWWFLTGDKKQIYDLIAKGFLLAVDDGKVTRKGEPGDGVITHSTKFALVDYKGRVRAYFSGDEDKEATVDAEIVAAVKRVLAERT